MELALIELACKLRFNAHSYASGKFLPKLSNEKKGKWNLIRLLSEEGLTNSELHKELVEKKIKSF